MKTIMMPVAERAAISRRHNPNLGFVASGWMTNVEMEELILDLYGLRKVSDDPQDLTFAVEDDKKYMMYLLRGVV